MLHRNILVQTQIGQHMCCSVQEEKEEAKNRASYQKYFAQRPHKSTEYKKKSATQFTNTTVPRMPDTIALKH